MSLFRLLPLAALCAATRGGGDAIRCGVRTLAWVVFTIVAV